MMNPPGKAVISKLVTVSEFHTGEHGLGRCNPSRAGLNEPARGENGRAANFGPLPLCMELNLSGMATLRHHVENLLSLWCSAVDAGDCGCSVNYSEMPPRVWITNALPLFQQTCRIFSVWIRADRPRPGGYFQISLCGAMASSHSTRPLSRH